MEIDFKSAKMAVDITGSAPDTDISPDGQWAILHLTRNADPIVAHNRPASDADMSAINIAGTVEVHHSPSEDLTKSEFRIIQLACETANYALYVGRTSREGLISISFSAPPAYPQKFVYDFALDCGSELPFFNLRPPVIFPKRTNNGNLVPGIATVLSDMDDHPNTRMRVAFPNKETNKVNYLAQAMRQAYFVTAFVIRDKQGKIRILAHVCWRALWKARYHWVGGNCIPYPVVGTFDAGKSITGPPTLPTWGRTGGSLAAKITNPNLAPDETANALARTALKNLDAHPMFWNRFYGNKWPADVTSDFWSP
jgi:hypothetical protein